MKKNLSQFNYRFSAKNNHGQIQTKLIRKSIIFPFPFSLYLYYNRNTIYILHTFNKWNTN